MASNDDEGLAEISGWRWILGHIFVLLRQFGNPLILAFVVCFVVWQLGHDIVAFAGRTSVATLAFEVAAKLNATVALSLTLSGITTALWANEYRRHKKTRERLTERTEALEKRLDPQRESSKLTRHGTTQEGDQ